MEDKNNKFSRGIVSAQTIAFVRGSETSKQAAESMKPFAGSLRERVYEALIERGNYGATDEELQTLLQLKNGSTARPRRVELEKIGAVYRTEMKRVTKSGRKAAVYCANPGVDITKKTGRPPAQPKDALTEKVTVYLTQDQKRKLERLARQDKRAVGELARECLGIGWQLTNDGRCFFPGMNNAWESDKK